MLISVITLLVAFTRDMTQEWLAMSVHHLAAQIPHHGKAHAAQQWVVLRLNNDVGALQQQFTLNGQFKPFELCA